jgi:hypothetical protein
MMGSSKRLKFNRGESPLNNRHYTMTNDRLRLLIRAVIKNLDNWRKFYPLVPIAYLPPIYQIIVATYADMASAGHAPSDTALLSKIHERVTIADSLTQDEWRDLRNLIQDKSPVNMTPEEVADWSYEYLAHMKQWEIANALNEVDPCQVGEFLSKAADDLRKARPSKYASDAELNPFLKGLERKEELAHTPTELGFLDFHIRGFVKGRMYSLLGPTGSAKTTLSAQMAATFAKKLLGLWRHSTRQKGTLGKVFYVTTEDGEDEIKFRMLSCAARVNRSKISGESAEPLTTKETLSDNDRKLAKQQSQGVVFSETDRLDMGVKSLGKNVRIIDLKDDAVIPKGTHPIDYIQEQIAHAINTDLREDGTPKSYCALIIVDHSEVLISRLKQASKGKQPWDIVEEIPQSVRDKLATHFNCPVWLVHQLSGKANEKKENANIEHTDAKGSKSWGTYFDVCFSVTKIDREKKTCFLQITKNRYGALGEHIELTLLGEICTLEQTSVLNSEQGEHGVRRNTNSGGGGETSSSAQSGDKQVKCTKQKLVMPDS